MPSKQYFKEKRALRTEITINNSKDFGIGKDIANLPYLQEIGRNINRRLLDVQHVSQKCGVSGESIDRIVKPNFIKHPETSIQHHGLTIWNYVFLENLT